MAIGETVSLLIENLGVSFPELVLIITVLGSLIFFAVELRFGIMMLFFMCAIETLMFWRAGYSGYELSLFVIVTLSVFVLMTLSLLLVKRKQVGYGGII